MDDRMRLKFFEQDIETTENLRQAFEKAGGSFYKANILGDVTLLEFLETCARNSIRFYWAKDPELNKSVEDNYKKEVNGDINLDSIINELEIQRTEHHVNSNYRKLYNIILDRLRVLQSHLLHERTDDYINLDDQDQDEDEFIIRYCGHNISSMRTCCETMKNAIDNHAV